MTKTPNLQIQKQPTRKQMSRAEREAARSRQIWLGVGGVLVLAVLVLVIGYLWRTVFILNEPVARVNGEVITTRQFQNRIRLAQRQAQDQVRAAQALGDQNSYTYYLQQLQDKVSLADQVLNGMVDDVLLAQGAPAFGVAVTPDEVQLYIEKQLRYDRNPATPGPTSTPRPVPTASSPITQTPTPSSTPFPSPTPVTLDGFNALYQKQLGELAGLGIGEQEYRDLVKNSLLVDKVRTAIQSAVVTTTDQVKFQYLRVAAEDVLTVSKDVNTQGFATIYQSVLSQTYPITAVTASETGDWVPQQEISATTEFGPDLAKALFAAAKGETISVINAAGTATYIATLQDHQVQPINSSFLQSRQQAAVEDWLSQRRKSDFILPYDSDIIPVAAIPTALPQAPGTTP